MRLFAAWRRVPGWAGGPGARATAVPVLRPRERSWKSVGPLTTKPVRMIDRSAVESVRRSNSVRALGRFAQPARLSTEAVP